MRAAVRTTALVLPALLLAACSAAPELAAGDRYANCADLGELSVLSLNRTDAERRMRARVLELGGDRLLFGERGRSRQLDRAPDEVVERRNHLLTAGAADTEQPLVLTIEQAEAPDALETAETNAARRRSAATAAERLADAPGELWFYGAALRCNSIANGD
jgi:hypothetical protein